jgi:hypothetical protein
MRNLNNLETIISNNNKKGNKKNLIDTFTIKLNKQAIHLKHISSYLFYFILIITIVFLILVILVRFEFYFISVSIYFIYI